MIAVLARFSRWIIQKFASVALIVGLGLAAGGLWLFLKDNVDFVAFDDWRHDLVRTLTGERAQTQAALADVLKTMDRLTAETNVAREHVRLADQTIAELKDLESFWGRWIARTEQQKANAEQIERLTTLRKAAKEKIAALEQQYKLETAKRDGLEIALGKLDARLSVAAGKESKTMHYLRLAWERLRFWVLVTVAVYFLGPTAGKLVMYFGVAPLIARGRPVRLERDAAAMPDVGSSGASLEVILAPGEQLRVKEKFLQASDEAMRRTTRMMLDWRMPFTCLAAGLAEMTELSRPRSAGELRVTLAHHDSFGELCLVTLPEGAALVLRPSFLAGVVTEEGGRLIVRRRWQLFRWQAWATLQFRFFEFQGPCRLVIAGNRGVRAERLDERAGDAMPARRANQDATIGFTPNLDYRPARVDTFWGYYRGANPLFDDLFVGRGIFLCQQISAAGDARQARRFWAGLWGAVTKVFGL